VHLDLTYLYPKLLHSVDYETRTWWKDFYGQLEEHELIHGEISTKAAHRLDDILENLGPGDCGGYKNIIKVKIKQVMDRMKQDQAAYDKLVEHGLKQDRNMGRYP
jgi:predicted secreted Zn-dependent protease